jgi:hypothetical protein
MPILKRRQHRRSWRSGEDEDKLFIPHARSNRQYLPMDTGRRSSGRQQAAHAPRLPAANHAPPWASAGQRPFRRLRPSSPHANYISEERKNDYSLGIYSPDSNISYSYQNMKQNSVTWCIQCDYFAVFASLCLCWWILYQAPSYKLQVK